MRALTRATVFLAILVLLGQAKAPRGPAQEAADQRVRAIHLLQRATYGPRPQDIDVVLSTGTERWLDRQLHPERIDDSGLEKRLDAIPSTSMSLPELLREYPPGQVLQPLRRLAQGDSLPEGERRRLRRELGEHGPGRILADMVTARLTRAVHSERQLEEMMTAFWFDHFNVFWGKGADRWLVADYERTAIRPHVFGSFEDMVLATARHPAMLFYLDNFRSFAPDSSLRARERREQITRRMSRRRMTPGAEARLRERMRGDPDRPLPGINENYARELMELHTLGVDGGYTQDDVVAVARVLTGWTFQQPGNRGQMMQARASFRNGELLLPDMDYDDAYRFRFRSELHDAGEKVVLGHTFDAGGGQEEGVELIRMLARHPSTARHIASQLATRFVADEPAPAMVDHLAEVFLETGGDLREVVRALFTSENFYAEDAIAARVKSPFQLVASTLRMTHGRMPNARVLVDPLRSLGQAPYLAEPPTGYPETSAQWASSGSMINRMNFATAYVTGELKGVGPNGELLFEDIRRHAADPLEGMAAVLLPGTDPSELLAIIREDLQANPPARERDAGIRALSLMLGSPEFQRH